MNTVEHIVECYFRYCKKCFTMADVKVQGGVNRQIDLLAYNAKSKEQFHVESSVTHCTMWAPSTKDLQQLFDKKFMGIPEKRKGKNTDSARKRNYFKNIQETYRRVGLSPSRIARVFIVWDVKDKEKLADFLARYRKRNHIMVSVLGFRDSLLPGLKKEISTSNYEDEVLRMLSLLKQQEIQTRNLLKKESERRQDAVLNCE